jgi:hypothetical protein
MLTLFWTNFKLGLEKQIVEVVVNSDGNAKVTLGVSEFFVLRTT